MIVAAK